MSLQFYTYAEHPELDAHRGPLLEAWPAFMHEDPVANECFEPMYDAFPDWQHYLVDKEDGELVAQVNSLPVPLDLASLPDRGIDEALERGTSGAGVGSVASAIQVVIRQERQGQGLAARCLRHMRGVAAGHGCTDLVAPVRPSWKARYPLTTAERYASWTTPAGLPFDPWMRVHARLGASTVRVCPRSMTIPGTVSEWEEWTQRTFPASGRYVVAGALEPVEIDVDADRGVYVEPNVWMHHRI